MPIRWNVLAGTQSVFTRVLIGSGIVGLGIVGIVSVSTLAAPSPVRALATVGRTASRVPAALPHPVYFNFRLSFSLPRLFQNRSLFALPYLGTADHFAVTVTSRREATATWVFPRLVQTGTRAVLWEYPNGLAPVSPSDVRFQIATATVQQGQTTDRVAMNFAVPSGGPGIHATYLVELFPKPGRLPLESPPLESPPLESPPLGQLPEVPWAVGLPLIGVLAAGYARRRVAGRFKHRIMIEAMPVPGREGLEGQTVSVVRGWPQIAKAVCPQRNFPSDNFAATPGVVGVARFSKKRESYR